MTRHQIRHVQHKCIGRILGLDLTMLVRGRENTAVRNYYVLCPAIGNHDLADVTIVTNGVPSV